MPFHSYVLKVVALGTAFLVAGSFAADYPTASYPSKPISLAGKVSQIVWVNPRSWINVETTDGTYTLVLAAPNTLVKTGKMTRATFTAGMDVTVTGFLAKDGTKTAQANTISSDGKLIFDRSTLTQ